ncbi:(2Fe-2S)-binding protein [Thiohalorhabdus sp.]|uniref:(2Fe-2S)-binding protein n=1 Tax=Thiohalorhabdus sp. TaxID=3094134 RepID=UPI002FC36354
MYVCICNAVSDGSIHQAAAEGARTLADLQDMLGLATGCGTCADIAMACLHEAHSQAGDTEELPDFQTA